MSKLDEHLAKASGLALVLAVAGFSATAEGARYWDLNGSEAGAGGGTAPSGIWRDADDDVAFWNDSSNGTNATQAWSNSTTNSSTSSAFFAAGTNATGAYDVTISGDVQAQSIVIQEGALTFLGADSATLRVGSGGLTIEAGASGATHIDSSITLISISHHHTWENASAHAFIVDPEFTVTAARTLTINNSSTGGTTFNGVLRDGGGGAKLSLVVNSTGSGVTTLTNANTYTVSTTVTQGTLLANNSSGSATGTSPVTVEAAGVLGGTGAIGTTTTVNGGTISPGNVGGTESLAFGADLTFVGDTSKVIMDIDGIVRGAPVNGYDALDIAGQLTYDGTLTLDISSPVANDTYNLFDFGSFAGELDAVVFTGGAYSAAFSYNGVGIWQAVDGGQTFVFDQSTGELSVVPEPGALGLAGVLLGMGLVRRRRAG